MICFNYLSSLNHLNPQVCSHFVLSQLLLMELQPLLGLVYPHIMPKQNGYKPWFTKFSSNHRFYFSAQSQILLHCICLFSYQNRTAPCTKITAKGKTILKNITSVHNHCYVFCCDVCEYPLKPHTSVLSDFLGLFSHLLGCDVAEIKIPFYWNFGASWSQTQRTYFPNYI